MLEHVDKKVLANLGQVVEALEPLGLENFVFVGGAVVGLLLTDNAASSARFTQDVDVVTSLSSKNAFYKLEEGLGNAGFVNDTAVICRWRTRDVIVDIMPKDSSILGFSNRWYESLIEHAIRVTLDSGVQISVASGPYILASKLEAFKSRGQDDYLFSHDLTDIIILLDGRETLVNEVLTAKQDVKDFIQVEFSGFLSIPDFIDAVSANLLPDLVSQRRASIILKRIKTIVEGKL